MVHHYRRLITVLFLVGLYLLVPTVHVLAATPTVTITVSGFLCTKPEDLTAPLVNKHTVTLEWTKGTNADRTLIKYKKDEYPTDRTDGELAYFGTGNSVAIESLDDDQAYFFCAWSYNQEHDIYSSNYAQVTITTLKNPGMANDLSHQIPWIFALCGVVTAFVFRANITAAVIVLIITAACVPILNVVINGLWQ